ncbi:MAG: Re/Si-specific NAD(P)(+) transhydrogenase subunit alpha [Bacteroidetes bacterium]|nr:MAG: Re/Si-specific NAD(P)(+) transhydrogenase subunit alpha [Bacteroidota bacterium]
MIIGILKAVNDARVAMVPETVAKLIGKGHEVWVEQGAGEGAFFSDETYTAVGAKVGTRAEVLKKAEVLLSIEPPSLEELRQLPAGSCVCSLFNPLVNTELAEQIRKLDIRAFSLDRIPRTTIAQSMDVLSSMASIAGYKAVLVAANILPGYLPMMMTAAGTIPPARVLVLGAGVAGLQAIATARRLGAVVEAFDVRSAVKEEVESLGAKFVEVEGAAEDQAAGGYAIEQSEDYQKRQRELIHQRGSQSDIIITTAQIPGRKAPLLVEARTVEAMRPGSVVVDLAAVSGGNCALTQNDKTIVHNGVSIVGDSNLPAKMPAHASKLFGNNLLNFILYVFQDGKDNLDMENEIVKGSLV